MRTLFIIIGISATVFLIIWGVQYEIKFNAEKAYFEGQKDYMEGDVRIKTDENGNVIWAKSPWDNRGFNDVYFDPATDNSYNIGL